ncbi:Protein YOP1 {ECO:0000256/RuleBase:RU362006} [Serendipita indica DSM 11827]|uniref:Protein YOP1 n=1 Tax=Serendipita indica (strain DSM 11827) TaxID=1109443 RepID=G4T8P9_SERID|nr:Protein YOP1 {ECO:0000256/RuleBase:RU362006} [Serendipita indica DSM 11827]CCA67708.1 hypothetical protein PIIN_01535 [Serendipita indica DSM 11827]
MGLLYLVSTIGTGLLGFIYPSFATFKLLAANPRDNETLESWLFYWVVIGLVAGFEQLGEWIINWAPLYYEAKFLFIIWLISPGTQGSTYIYQAYVKPFFTKNTENIDKAIASSRTNAIGFVQSSLQALWAFIIGRLTNAQQAAAQNQGPAPGQPGNPAQNGPLQGILGLAQQMGPAGLAALGSLLNPGQNKQAANQAVQQQSFPNPNATPLTTPLPPSNPGTPGTDLRYRAPTGANGRNTPPPAFPVPQHQT